MPLYELLLILRPMPKSEISSCIKRTSNLVWGSNGSLMNLKFLGLKDLPFKKAIKTNQTTYKSGNYFLVDISVSPNSLKTIKTELKLDLDIVHHNWNLKDSSKVLENYECTLGEELRPASLRNSTQALLHNKNVLAPLQKFPRRTLHLAVSAMKLESDTSQSRVSPPGMLSVFQTNPKRLHRIQFLWEIFNRSGYDLRIAGGAVRDILQGQEPTDIDLATNALPDKAKQIVSEYGDIMRVIVTPSGLSHGTVAVKFKGLGDVDFNLLDRDSAPSITDIDPPVYDSESPFEITTLRIDKVTDGRHAEVVFINDWEKDAERRDLTINAMFLTIDKGELVDYFGGKSDLKDGTIKFVGSAEERIQEDYLRILRYFRFWSRYSNGKDPDNETYSALANNLQGLDKISGERIWSEMKKIFGYHPLTPTMQLMFKLAIFDVIGITNASKPIDQDSVIKDLEKVEQHVISYTKYLIHRKPLPSDKVNLLKLKEIIPSVLLATFFVDSDSCLQALKRLKYSNIERDTMLYIINNRASKEITLDNIKLELVRAPNSELNNVRNKICAYLISIGLEVTREVNKRSIPKHRIKNIIQSLRDEWAISDFTLDKEQLMSKMQNFLDDYEIETVK